MSSTIQKHQEFKGSINDVPFEREEVFDATASVVGAIEARWPITCSKETVEAIKGYVEAHEALHPSFSYKKFERENVHRIKEQTPEPKDVWLSYERSDFVKEAGTALPLAITSSLAKDQESVPNFEQAVEAHQKESERITEQRREQYKDMTEEEALKLVSSNGTALLYLPDKYRNNEKVVSAAIANDEDAFRYAGASARDNDNLARQAINADPDNVKYLGQTLRNDPDLYQMAIERDNDLIKDIPVAMQHNKTIEKIIAKDNRRALGMEAKKLTISKPKEGAELSR